MKEHSAGIGMNNIWSTHLAMFNFNKSHNSNVRTDDIWSYQFKLIENGCDAEMMNRMHSYSGYRS